MEWEGQPFIITDDGGFFTDVRLVIWFGYNAIVSQRLEALDCWTCTLLSLNKNFDIEVAL